MLNKYLKNLAFLEEICSDGEKMVAKGKKGVEDQLIKKWNEACLTKLKIRKYSLEKEFFLK